MGGDLGSLWGLLWDKMGSLRIKEVVLGLGGDLGSLWGSVWDQMSGVRIKEVVLGLGEIWSPFGVCFGIKGAALHSNNRRWIWDGIWGIFGVSLGFALGSNGQLEDQGGGVGFGGDLGSLWGSVWDKTGSLRIKEVVLGWGRFGVSMGFAMG